MPHKLEGILDAISIKSQLNGVLDMMFFYLFRECRLNSVRIRACPTLILLEMALFVKEGPKPPAAAAGRAPPAPPLLFPKKNF